MAGKPVVGRDEHDGDPQRHLSACIGGTRQNAGVHLADPSSDLKSATGPRWVSLSGLTIELILVI
jgi:hypothetical protein